MVNLSGPPLSIAHPNSTSSSHSNSTPELLYETIFFASFYVLISIIATFGNLLVLVAIYKYHNLQTISNYLLANLALTDFLQGSVSVPLRLAELLSTGHVDHLCQVSLPISIVFGSTSNINILFVSIERFIAILFPYFYYNWATPNKIFVFIGLGWLTTVILGLLPSMGWGGKVPEDGQYFCRFTAFLTKDYITMLYIIVHFIPISTVIFLYGFILRASLRHTRRIHIQEKCVQQTISMPAESITDNTNTITSIEPNNAAKESAKQQKAAKMVSILVGLFIVLVAPIILIDLIEMVGGPSAPSALIKVTVCMIYTNHCVNVFVYAGCNREYRKSFKKIFASVVSALRGICGRYRK